jgi:hypothetical protein
MSRLIKVSENSNVEISEESAELLMSGTCRSFECEEFRANNCRMKTLLNAIEKDNWVFNNTWVTPSKYLLHLVKTGEQPASEMSSLMESLKEKWSCVASEKSCNCDFLDEIKLVNEKLNKTIL